MRDVLLLIVLALGHLCNIVSAEVNGSSALRTPTPSQTELQSDSPSTSPTTSPTSLSASPTVSPTAETCFNLAPRGWFAYEEYERASHFIYGSPPSKENLTITLDPPMSRCELEKLHTKCVERINEYRAGLIPFSDGTFDKSLEFNPPQQLTRAGYADVCASEITVGDFHLMEKECFIGAGVHAWGCGEIFGDPAQNFHCPKHGVYSYETALKTMYENLQESWDEGLLRQNNFNYLNMKSMDFNFASCGFAFSTDGRMYMTQNFFLYLKVPRTNKPTPMPITSSPTSSSPTTSTPTASPSFRPTFHLTSKPTAKPTRRNGTKSPTRKPTKQPSVPSPTKRPTHEPFDIRIIYKSSISNARKEIIEMAAKRVASIITKGSPGELCVTRLPPDCRHDVTKRLCIKDLAVAVFVERMDGPENTLAQAGPCLIDQFGKARFGVIQFDEADIKTMMKDGTFYSVVQHELIHTLGFGSLWGTSYYDLIRSSGSTLLYNGPQGNVGQTEIGGTGQARIEDSHGLKGNMHWKESIYRNELMTGISEYSEMPLSKLTIRSLEDLGYQVDINQADSYSFPSSSKNREKLATGQLHDTILQIPIAQIPSQPKDGREHEFELALNEHVKKTSSNYS